MNKSVGIRDGAHHFLPDGISVIRKSDIVIGSRAFTHLFVRIIESHDACTDFLNQDLRHDKGFAKTGVKSFGEIAGEFKMWT